MAAHFVIQAQEVELDGHMGFLCGLADDVRCVHAHLVELGTGHHEQVGVGEVAVHAGGDALGGLIGVAAHLVIQAAGVAGVVLKLLRGEEVAGEDKVLAALVAPAGQLIHVAGVVFRLHAQAQLDLPGVFLLQVQDGRAVFRPLGGGHAAMAHIAGGEIPCGMVRKAKHVKAALNGSRDVLFIRSHGVLAAERVRMEIGFHEHAASFAQKFWLLRWIASASRHFSLLRSIWACISCVKPSRSRFSTSSTS